MENLTWNKEGKKITVSEYRKGLSIEVVDFNTEDNDGEIITTYYYVEEGSDEEDPRGTYMHIEKEWATADRWLDPSPIWSEELIEIAEAVKKWRERG